MPYVSETEAASALLLFLIWIIAAIVISAVEVFKAHGKRILGVLGRALDNLQLIGLIMLFSMIYLILWIAEMTDPHRRWFRQHGLDE